MRVLLLVLLGLSAGLCGATSLRGTRDPAQDKVGKLTPQQILALCRFFQLPQCTDSQGHSGSAHSSEEESSSEDDAASLLSGERGVKESTEREICPPWYPECLKRR
ncbi:uncharacterized protein LOC143291247 isoform X1 [Babylonia areolata]|uniref:uncharacterized protein LOC143291247 isoform X1 n=1 Tax=Babylonia areolata TaxID=304850 RepID=UPI003FD26E70